MKLLLIARPSAHRNEVSRFLERRGAVVETCSSADGSALRGRGSVDAIVVLEDGVGAADEMEDGVSDVPVIRWPQGNGLPGEPRSSVSRATTTVPAGSPPLSSFDLQELAFRVAQAAHGTVDGSTHVSGVPRLRTGRSRRQLAESTAEPAAGADAA